MYNKRSEIHKINKLVEIFPAVAIIGPRQCGKSTLVKSLTGDWKYYDLESPERLSAHNKRSSDIFSIK